VAVDAYADEGYHFVFLLRGLRVVFLHVWHVVVMWGSLCWLILVVELYPGMRGVLHFLQMPCFMWGGIFVLVRCAIRLRSAVYLFACSGSVLIVSCASRYRVSIRCCATCFGIPFLLG